MKKITSFLALILLASTSFAQNTSTSTIGRNESSSQGLRLSLLKPSLSADFKASREGRSLSTSEAISDSLGFGIGYASLPIQQLGWTSNLGYIEMKNNGVSVAVMRLDGNMAFAFNSIVNAKGGLNISKITKGDTDNKFAPAIGLQAGLGFQATKNFGIDIGYTQMNQTANLDGVNVELKLSGLEIGVNATF